MSTMVCDAELIDARSSSPVRLGDLFTTEYVLLVFIRHACWSPWAGFHSTIFDFEFKPSTLGFNLSPLPSCCWCRFEVDSQNRLHCLFSEIYAGLRSPFKLNPPCRLSQGLFTRKLNQRSGFFSRGGGWIVSPPPSRHLLLLLKFFTSARLLSPNLPVERPMLQYFSPDACLWSWYPRDQSHTYTPGGI